MKKKLHKNQDLGEIIMADMWYNSLNTNFNLDSSFLNHLFII